MTLPPTVAAYLELTKPRITWLILMSAAIGYWFGLAQPFSLLLFFHTLAGTALIASGTAAFNQIYERRADSLMRRTRSRPLPSGRLAPQPAALFASLLSLAGLAQLTFLVNPLTGALGLFTMASYLLLYTPLKQRSPHSTTLGAIPGAMPPLIGFAAARGALAPEAFALFAILFLWQFPHFYAIAWLYRDDYSRAGIRMFPVLDPSGHSTARRILVFLLLLLPVSLLPNALHMTGLLYLAGALALGAFFLRSGFAILRSRSLPAARAVLLASVFYLPALYALMLLDRQ